MAKLLDKALHLVPWIFDSIFKALGVHDKTKRVLVVSLALNFLLLPPAALYTYGLYQKAQWMKHNPHVYPPAPADEAK